MENNQVEAIIAKFWQGENWPKDAMGKVFFARALNTLGIARYSDEWDSKLPVPESQNGTDVTRKQRIQFERIANEFISAFQSSRLQTYLRAKEGGGFLGPQPPHFWNLDQTESRFRFCQIDPANPLAEIDATTLPEYIASQPPNPGMLDEMGYPLIKPILTQYIFVDEEGLAHVLSDTDQNKPMLISNSTSQKSGVETVATLRNPSKSEGRKFLKSIEKEWRDNDCATRLRPTRDRFVDKGIEKFPGSSTAFWRNIIWKEFRPHEWSTRGRRKKVTN